MRLRCLAPIALFVSVSISLGVRAQSSRDPVYWLGTADSQIELSAGVNCPRLLRLDGRGANLWQNEKSELLPSFVEINNASFPVTWQLRRDLTNSDAHHVVLVYDSTNPHLRLKWIWEARATFGPLEHRITVENLGDKEIWLPMIDSLDIDWSLPEDTKLLNFYVEKGGDTPSAQGTHQEMINNGYKWVGKSSTYELPLPGVAREIIPAELVYRADRPQSGWFAGIEFSGRTRIALFRKGDGLSSSLGLNPDPGPFRTRLDPEDEFETPAVFLGTFRDGPDSAANQLHPWVHAVLGNPLTWRDPRYPLTVNNSWGSGMQVDEALALRMIDESKALGLEMFHLDAGWFRGVGDWYPDSVTFPHGLAAIADAAHRNGLRFGIWVDWTQAGIDTQPGALNVHDPMVNKWLISDVAPGWKPEAFKGQTIDIGVPGARAYALKELRRIVDDYHLDMLEHDGYLVAKGCMRNDHPHAPLDRATMKVIHDWGADFVIGNNSTDVSYHAVRSYYSIYEQLRREHPGLIFEICNDGGRMVDFGSAAHGDYFSITDTYDPLSNRRAFYDTSYMLPPAMLESYVEKWPVPRLENFLYMLRSGMMGWITVMQDTSAWSPQQHEAAHQAIALYKQRLRPLIRDAHLYHVSPRPDGIHWDGMEYWDPARGKGVVFAFRGSIADEPEHLFLLSGLEPGRRYRLHYQDGTISDHTFLGRDLANTGLQVHLKYPLSSELVFFEREP
ncbi:MAG: alpha-galactosidase [Terracidiphilus sp.]